MLLMWYTSHVHTDHLQTLPQNSRGQLRREVRRAQRMYQLMHLNSILCQYLHSDVSGGGAVGVYGGGVGGRRSSNLVRTQEGGLCRIEWNGIEYNQIKSNGMKNIDQSINVNCRISNHFKPNQTKPNQQNIPCMENITWAVAHNRHIAV